MDEIDDISVIGPPKHMTDEEWKAALPGILAEGEVLYKAAFIARFVELGVPEHVGESEWAAYWESVKDRPDDVGLVPPAEAADECMSYWSED